MLATSLGVPPPAQIGTQSGCQIAAGGSFRNTTPDDGARDVSARERGLGGAQPHEQAAQRRVEQHAILLSSPIALRGGDVQLLDGLTLGRLATAVVPLGRRRVGVPGELLGGGEIHAGVEQITDDDVDTCQDHRSAYRSPLVRRSHSRAVRLADSRLCAM